MRKGIIYFHQGWTDIINCLPLVKYYLDSYDKIVLVVRSDAKEMIEYYCNDVLEQIEFLYVDKKVLDINSILQILPDYYRDKHDYLFHGQHDVFRKDNYVNSFANSNGMRHFVTNFYEAYSIPAEVRFKFNTFRRDTVLEETEYKDFFLQKSEIDYSLSHTPKYWNNKLDVSGEVYSLDDSTNNPFSFIKILCNSRELHLVDSMWASMLYNLENTTPVLQDTKIFLYPHNYSGGILDSNNYKTIKMPKNWSIIR